MTWFARLFGRDPDVVVLRRRAGRLRDRGLALLEQSKALRGEARRLDDQADEIEFGPLTRLPRTRTPTWPGAP